MSTKHTPGPWTAKLSRTAIAITTINGAVIAMVSSGNLQKTANARLIAAAPELLAAARKALAECCDLIETDAGRALESVIAKAEGGAA